MQVSPISSTSGAAASQYAERLRASLAAKAKANTGAVDGDGDHDGDTGRSDRTDARG